MFVLFLTLFLCSGSYAQMNVGEPPFEVSPPSNVGDTPIEVAPRPPDGVLVMAIVCPKLNLPPGCTCVDGLIKPVVTCTCADMLKGQKTIYKAWVTYDQHNQCVINYFPGCTPKLLNSSDVDLCKKYNRQKNKFAADLKPALSCNQLQSFCPINAVQKCHESPDSLELICQGSKEVLNMTFKIQN
ncbi:MAG: hypothetical protein ACOYL6_12245 [Bacteriovoracaceae bacterium]